MTSGTAADDPVRTIFELPHEPEPLSSLDEILFVHWKRLNIAPAYLCSDAVFLRRAYVDLTGTLPEPDQVRNFLQDSHPGKRVALIDALLDRDEFASYWGMKWADLLRIKAEFPINLWPQAARVYHDWVVASLRANKPYDQFARELLTASGSNFKNPPANFYRAVQNRQPETLAKAVALTFMGVRVEHWPRERLQGMAAFFSRVSYKTTREWKEEIVYDDPHKPGAPQEGVLPDGTRVRFTSDRDPRLVFADWLIQPRNPWFARNIANRIWAWLMGRGIVHEPDDIREDNPPLNEGLLSLLERELIQGGWNLKRLYRLVATSATYQLSPIPRAPQPEALDAFAAYRLRRLEAEVLADAICQITGTTEQYVSPIPEPFTLTPPTMRSIALFDGSITSAFLELFGRPPRDTGYESERNNQISAAQRLYLLNSSHIQRKLQSSPRLRALVPHCRSPEQVATQLYPLILSRFPHRQEMEAIARHARRVPNLRELVIDVAWALINTAEFLYRH